MLILLGVIAWYFVYRSGVHATIAGVALGLVMARRPGGRAVHALEPWSNGVILPLFAFSAAMVVVPQVRPSELDPAFWGILIALPVGKIIGITLAGGLGGLVARRGSGTPLTFADLLVVGALGGIGFTVSLLMNELAFADTARGGRRGHARGAARFGHRDGRLGDPREPAFAPVPTHAAARRPGVGGRVLALSGAAAAAPCRRRARRISRPRAHGRQTRRRPPRGSAGAKIAVSEPRHPVDEVGVAGQLAVDDGERHEDHVVLREVLRARVEALEPHATRVGDVRGRDAQLRPGGDDVGEPGELRQAAQPRDRDEVLHLLGRRAVAVDELVEHGVDLRRPAAAGPLAAESFW